MSAAIRRRVTSMWTNARILLSLTSLVLAGCMVEERQLNEGGDSSNCEEVCQQASNRCQEFPADGCTENLCVAMIPTSGCLSAIAGASCAELTEGGSSLTDVCWPRCAQIGAACQGDRIAQCADVFGDGPRAVLRDCNHVCAINGQSYTGVCGYSYEGQPSNTGFDVCWCE